MGILLEFLRLLSAIAFRKSVLLKKLQKMQRMSLCYNKCKKYEGKPPPNKMNLNNFTTKKKYHAGEMVKGKIT